MLCAILRRFTFVNVLNKNTTFIYIHLGTEKQRYYGEVVVGTKYSLFLIELVSCNATYMQCFHYTFFF